MGAERRKSLVAIFFLVLLMSYKVGVTMFVHTHNVDGSMVAHSHPFTNSNHTHSSSQALSIALLSSFNGVVHTVLNDYNCLNVEITELSIIETISFVDNQSTTTLSLRAPPYCC